MADGAVTNPKLAAGSVLSANIGAGAVATPNIADQAITTSKIAPGAVSIGSMTEVQGPEAEVLPGQSNQTTATCPPGTFATGGGWSVGPGVFVTVSEGVFAFPGNGNAIGHVVVGFNPSGSKTFMFAKVDCAANIIHSIKEIE